MTWAGMKLTDHALITYLKYPHTYLLEVQERHSPLSNISITSAYWTAYGIEPLHLTLLSSYAFFPVGVEPLDSDPSSIVF